MTWLGIFLMIWSLDVTNSRTFKRFFTFHVYNENTSGKLIEVQERSFEFGENGSVSIRLSCNDATDTFWGNDTTFNIFLCNESPKTRWLFLYPDWGMCFDNAHPYHHCIVDKLTKESPTTWTYHSAISQSQNLVARIRLCPLYHASSKLQKSYSTFMTNDSFVAKSYHCQYSGAFLNQHSRLSLDETWNPYVYGMLTSIYGAMSIKALYEIIRFWNFRVNCSFYVYTLVFIKFSTILCISLFYLKILTADNLFDGYIDEAFILALVQAGKFTAYYLTLLMISSGYCIYNTKPPVNSRVQVGVGMTLYTLYFYLFVLEDSYIEVPTIVITSAAYAAVLALFWAYHFRRLLLIRYEFHALPDRHQHTRAKIQICRKEILIAVAFAEIIFFLAYILVFEFYRADNYPVPGVTGVLVTECLEFLLILPLTLLFNMRDLTKFYPTPAPPPIIHVVKTPDNGYKISLKERGAAADEVSINEQTSEIQLVRLPSAHSTASTSSTTSLHVHPGGVNTTRSLRTRHPASSSTIHAHPPTSMNTTSQHPRRTRNSASSSPPASISAPRPQRTRHPASSSTIHVQPPTSMSTTSLDPQRTRNSASSSHEEGDAHAVQI